MTKKSVSEVNDANAPDWLNTVKSKLQGNDTARSFSGELNS